MVRVAWTTRRRGLALAPWWSLHRGTGYDRRGFHQWWQVAGLRVQVRVYPS